MNARTTIAAFAAAFLSAFPAAAEWTLAPAESRIGFISVKAGDIAESHYFREVRGSVSASGAAQIVIPLDSVETNIDIRNERMREFLFETEQYPTAAVAAAIDLEAMNDLEPGERKPVDFAGELTLHGASVPFETTLRVTRLSATRALVETTDPIILYADQYNLLAGVKKLMELAGLPSITPAVPVSASLVFEKAE